MLHLLTAAVVAIDTRTFRLQRNLQAEHFRAISATKVSEFHGCCCSLNNRLHICEFYR